MDKNHDEQYVSMISIDSESCMSIIHENEISVRVIILITTEENSLKNY